MTQRSPQASAALLASVLVFASSISYAAPARHKKAVKQAPTAAPSAPAPEREVPEKSEAVEPATSASPPAPEPPATPRGEAAHVADSASASAAASSPVESSAATPPDPASASETGLSDRELEALGRREAARIAAGRSEVAVWASVDAARRAFKYSDPVGQQYAAYRLPLAPMLSIGLEAYPFASSAVPVLQDLGFRARFSKAFAVDSKTPEGATIDTSWTRFGADVRQRLLLPSAHPVELGFTIGADGSYFDMSTKQVVPALLPSARTVSVRVGLDGRLQLVRQFGLELAVAYLAPTTRGAIYERFRDPHLRGVDGDFAAILQIAPGLEARAAARYTRYFASFKPVLGDRLVAGGALDEQFQFGLGVRYAH
jgi:hypothetical protein